MEDKRPEPRPRKNPLLWQAYQSWVEVMELRKAYLLRISSIDAGKSNMSRAFAEHVMDMLNLDASVKWTKNQMIIAGSNIPVWEWITTIKGMKAGGIPAKLLAQIDDIERFATVSKLWRFSGWGVIDGHIDRCQRGVKSPYNRRLKSICWEAGEQFIRQRTPLYSDIYYEEKARQRRLHPHVVCRECGCIWEDCDEKVSHHKLFNDGHLHNRARRKMIKIFLQHLWERWRTADGLPVSEPYVAAILGHTNIIKS